MENSTLNNYLSQTEASTLAGVSTSTLMRFAEAGYFKIIQRNGQTQFSKQEICEVFGPAINTNVLIKEEELQTSSNIKAVETSESRVSIENNSLLSQKSVLAQKVEKIIEPSTQIEAEQVVASNNGEIENINKSSIKALETNSDTERSNSIEAFKSVLQLQEELLAQKESRINELTKERDWLRSRLEKMEDKSDRDQMLLMVESQKVRTLIDKAAPKNNIFKLALDWLGGKPSEVEEKSNHNSNSSNRD